MALVVINGVQYDDSRLPAHVNPKEAVPLDEWRRTNRRVSSRPRMATAAPKPAPAKPAAKSKKQEPAKPAAKSKKQEPAEDSAGE